MGMYNIYVITLPAAYMAVMFGQKRRAIEGYVLLYWSMYDRYLWQDWIWHDRIRERARQGAANVSSMR